jgi:hypothetical protein
MWVPSHIMEAYGGTCWILSRCEVRLEELSCCLLSLVGVDTYVVARLIVNLPVVGHDCRRSVQLIQKALSQWYVHADTGLMLKLLQFTWATSGDNASPYAVGARRLYIPVRDLHHTWSVHIQVPQASKSRSPSSAAWAQSPYGLQITWSVEEIRVP